MILPKGTTIYTLHPYSPKGPGGFFADESTLAASKKSVNAYHEATQVGHSGNSRPFAFPARQTLQAFTLKKDRCVGKAHALANHQYGPGGGLQYFISKKDRRTLTAGSLIPLTSP